LRLDVNNPPSFVPANNPFVNDPNVLDEIWDLGLRNPWRFSFDRATGDLYLGDVGQSSKEEIDFEAGGSAGALNFGWRCMEGTLCTGLSGCTCNSPSLEKPIHEYDTHVSGNCCVIGGCVYRGSAICDLQGAYFFGDYCSARIWSLRYTSGQVTELVDRTAELAPGGTMSIDNISSFGEDAAGELFVCDIGDGEVYQVVARSIVDCNLNGLSDSCDIAGGASLDVNGDGVPDECQCASAPATYCTAKTNSSGCTPSIGFQGAPNVSSSLPFRVRADQVLNHENGLLFYGFVAASIPFQGGTLCVHPPIARLAVQHSGGSSSGHDCTGSFEVDLKPLLLSGADPNLAVGASVFAQYTYRDPGFAPPQNTGFTDALSFTICN
jgi:hypothetical protein